MADTSSIYKICPHCGQSVSVAAKFCPSCGNLFSEENSDFVAYERYAFVGGNRSSLNVTFVGADGTVHLIATATGGSSARFIKINTWSESSFLDTLIFAANDYMRDNDLEPLFVRSSEDELDE